MTPDEEIRQLKAERQFLLARASVANIVRFDESERWTGVSSNALVEHVFTGIDIDEDRYPRDPSDLRACEITVARLPGHLIPTGLALLVKYRQHVAKRYPQVAVDAP